uniref:Uncharacterized protein n=1 Tax=Anguilla anguilla TaxID=7936 RepID=A0A0E9PV70_ANGAN
MIISIFLYKVKPSDVNFASQLLKSSVVSSSAFELRLVTSYRTRMLSSTLDFH